MILVKRALLDTTMNGTQTFAAIMLSKHLSDENDRFDFKIYFKFEDSFEVKIHQVITMNIKVGK